MLPSPPPPQFLLPAEVVFFQVRPHSKQRVGPRPLAFHWLTHPLSDVILSVGTRGERDNRGDGRAIHHATRVKIPAYHQSQN